MGSVVVVGGGIAGLTAALDLAEAGHQVTVVESTDRLGGKIQTGPDGIETGPEQFLMRDGATGGPSGVVALLDRLGLLDDIVHPATGSAGLWVDGTLRPLPGGTVMGVPGPGAVLDGIAELSADDVDKGVPVLPAGDIAVGVLVRERLGGAVVEHLVDPLLGGVYAGRADLLSLQATIPALHAELRTRTTLRDAVAATAAASRAHASTGLAPASAPKPVFGTVVGGLSRLVDALAERLASLGVQVKTGTPVRDLSEWPADAHVIAVPAKPAAALTGLADLAALPYASIGLATLRLPPFDLPELSGFLVPADQGLTIKAGTFFTRKWTHLAAAFPGEVVLRTSIGRYGDTEALHQTDATLLGRVLDDLRTILGAVPEPTAGRVTRWGGALPQYAPGHVDRVAAARDALADRPIALAGAAFDGVGLPVCITSGARAAAHLGGFLP
ncbi:protoporphyrinogen oxidase [Hamadaea tsunoensis]|uniref:protoporphyrinogen oxidase n=1 Tax=Hamadaea tsunoensis TaxID=53368 RepID=UPI00040E6F3A|nr:protoporphyrinogen oxidase [Hamadaea tsunoensis]